MELLFTKRSFADLFQCWESKTWKFQVCSSSFFLYYHTSWKLDSVCEYFTYQRTALLPGIFLSWFGWHTSYDWQVTAMKWSLSTRSKPSFSNFCGFHLCYLGQAITSNPRVKLRIHKFPNPGQVSSIVSHASLLSCATSLYLFHLIAVIRKTYDNSSNGANPPRCPHTSSHLL